MVQLIINEREILETIKTRVGSNGQISVGKKHAGKVITAYIIEKEAVITGQSRVASQGRSWDTRGTLLGL